MNAKRQEEAYLALDKARSALLKKDASGALKHAKTAADLNPKLEEAWLILAAVSDPENSVKFLNRALEINPGSQKARKGMRWAAGRLRELQLKNVREKTRPPDKHA